MPPLLVNATLYSLKVSCPVRPKLSYDLVIEDWNSTYTVRVWGAPWVHTVEAWLPVGRIVGNGDVAQVSVDDSGVTRVHVEEGTGACNGTLCVRGVNLDANITEFHRKVGRDWSDGPLGPPNGSLVVDSFPDGCFTAKFEMFSDDRNWLSGMTWQFGNDTATGPNIDVCFENNELVNLTTAVPPDDGSSNGGSSLNWLIVLVACLALASVLGICGCFFACPMLTTNKRRQQPPPPNVEDASPNSRVLHIEKWSTVATTKGSISSPTLPCD